MTMIAFFVYSIMSKVFQKRPSISIDTVYVANNIFVFF